MNNKKALCQISIQIKEWVYKKAKISCWWIIVESMTWTNRARNNWFDEEVGSLMSLKWRTCSNRPTIWEISRIKMGICSSPQPRIYKKKRVKIRHRSSQHKRIEIQPIFERELRRLQADSRMEHTMEKVQRIRYFLVHREQRTTKRKMKTRKVL